MNAPIGLRRGWMSIVGLLVAIVIIVVLASYLFPKYLSGSTVTRTGPDGKKTTTRVPAPRERAQGVACASNLSQCRQAYLMATSTGDEQKPQRLSDLKNFGVTEAIAKCPVGGEFYRLDPAAGRIQCPHAGHEKY